MTKEKKRPGPTPKPKDPFLLRLDPKLLIEIKAIAEKERRTVTAQMHLMLEEWVQQKRSSR